MKWITNDSENQLTIEYLPKREYYWVQPYGKIKMIGYLSCGDIFLMRTPFGEFTLSEIEQVNIEPIKEIT